MGCNALLQHIRRRGATHLVQAVLQLPEEASVAGGGGEGGRHSAATREQGSVGRRRAAGQPEARGTIPHIHTCTQTLLPIPPWLPCAHRMAMRDSGMTLAKYLRIGSSRCRRGAQQMPSELAASLQPPNALWHALICCNNCHFPRTPPGRPPARPAAPGGGGDGR